MEFLKKQRVSFWLLVAAALLSVTGWILFMITSNIYTVPNAGWLIFSGIAAIILLGGGAYAASHFGSKAWITAALFIALALMMLLIGVVLRYRVDTLAEVLTYNPENEAGWKAVYTGIVCVGFYLFASIVLTVSAFLKQGAKENVK